MTQYYTEDTEVAQELAKRVLGGLLRIVRTFVPTVENTEKKREHVDATYLNGVLYVGFGNAAGIAVIRPKLHDMCKKKSPLRAVLAELDFSLTLNYGIVSPWLKMHEKNVRSASIGPDGLALVVAERLAELNLSATPGGIQNAERVRELVTTRVGEDYRLGGRFEVAIPQNVENAFVLAIRDTGVEVLPHLLVDFDGIAQLRLRPSMLHSETAIVQTFQDYDDGRIVQLTTETDTFRADQYFKVLEV